MAADTHFTDPQKREDWADVVAAVTACSLSLPNSSCEKIWDVYVNLQLRFYD